METNKKCNTALGLLFAMGLGIQIIKFASMHTFPDFGMFY